MKDLIFISNSIAERSLLKKQSVSIKEVDTLLGIGVVVVITAKYKYLRLEKLT
jgi:hypothetical protein